MLFKPMKRVPASEFQRNIGKYQDMALKEPITLTRNGRETCVVVPVGEYSRLKRRDRVAIRTVDLPDEIIELIAKAEMPPGFEHLDEELKDWKP